MKIIDQSYEILSFPDSALNQIEIAARTCYKSEGQIAPGSAIRLVKHLHTCGHGAMLEFADITVRFITNRGVSHELVRHRLCSFAQESTRYVRYGGEMEFIRPVWWDKDLMTGAQECWVFAMNRAECSYQELIDKGWRPEQAREVLPNSLKTEIVMKANLREWQHIFNLRCSQKAHPQMQALMLPLQEELGYRIPEVF